MKPSDFILHRDYLSIAQTGKNTYTVNVAGGTLQGNACIELPYNFTITSEPGAIDRVYTKKDSGDYVLGTYRDFYIDYVGYEGIRAFLMVTRTTATNLRVIVNLENQATTAKSYPAMTFKIKVATFRPPNVF